MEMGGPPNPCWFATSRKMPAILLHITGKLDRHADVDEIAAASVWVAESSSDLSPSCVRGSMSRDDVAGYRESGGAFEIRQKHGSDGERRRLPPGARGYLRDVRSLAAGLAAASPRDESRRGGVPPLLWSTAKSSLLGKASIPHMRPLRLMHVASAWDRARKRLGAAARSRPRGENCLISASPKKYLREDEVRYAPETPIRNAPGRRPDPRTCVAAWPNVVALSAGT